MAIRGNFSALDVYRIYGYCYAGAVDSELVDSVRRQTEQLLNAREARDDPALELRDRMVFQVYDVPLRSGPLRDLAQHSEILRFASELLGERAVLAWGLLLNKSSEPSSNWEIRWHQDTSVYCQVAPEGFLPEKRGGYWTFRPGDDTPGRLAVARIAIDRDVTATGGLFMLPGSHLLDNRWPDGGSAFADEQGVPVELEPGKVLFFNPLLMHRAGRNQRQSQRRVVHLYFRPETLRLPGGAEWIDW